MIKVFENVDELSRNAADLIVDIANRSIEKKDSFTLVLSGGSSPKIIYMLLSQPPFSERITWNKTYLFWGDERFVPENDPQNNYNMTREILLKKIPIPGDHIFPIPTSGDPKDCASEYEKTIYNFFNTANPSFDLILLGLGDNGHTASLFPYTDVLNEEKRLVKEVYVKALDMYRITMTAPIINKAESILFIIFGREKAEAVQNIIEGKYDPQSLPAQLIKPVDGTIRWFLDKEAASKLSLME